jgi:hypothetical protein
MATHLQVQLPRLHPGQSRIKAEARRFNVLACGRRYGKTTLGQDVLVGPALQGYPVAWFSPTYKMLTEVWREVRHVLYPVTKRISEQEHRLELVTGGVVDMWSLDAADTVRGRKYKRVAVDEAAMDPRLLASWQNIVRPTLTDYAGDAWFFSTPKGLNGFYTLYQLGQDDQQPDWISWQSPTADNPFISAAEIEAARRELPEEVFAQEYLAQFLEDGAGVFRRVLEAATTTPQAPQDGHVYAMGCDWGAVRDFTVLSVIDATTRQQVALERFNQIDFDVQLDRLQVLYDRYRPQQILAEKNGIGLPVLQRLQRMGLPVYAWDATNASKAAVVQTLALAFEKGELSILNDRTPAGKAQLGELLAYGAERLPSGLIRYGAPEGMHDDTVIALALAWALAARPARKTRTRDFSVEGDDE